MTGGKDFWLPPDRFRIFLTAIKAHRKSDPSWMHSSMLLIDTNVCIAILRAKSPRVASRFRAAMALGIAVSSISAAELYYGLTRCAHPERERPNLENLLGSVTILPFGAAGAEAFALLRNYLERRGQIIGQFDLLIAAHAIAENATLVTNNTREFSRVPTLALEDWTK